MRTFDSTRFNKITRITEIVLKVFKVILIIFGGLATLGFIIISLIPSETLWIDGDWLTLSLGFLPTELESQNIVFNGSLKPLLLAGTFITVTYTIFSYIVLNFIHRVIRKTREKVPFDPTSIKALYYFGYTLIVSGIVLPIFNFVTFNQINRAYNAFDVNIDYNVQFGMIFTGVLIYILANIFEYGAHLQSEVDATV